MSLEEYVIRKLETRIERLGKEAEELRQKINEVESQPFVHVDYLKSIIEKVCPAAQEEGWWDDIFR